MTLIIKEHQQTSHETLDKIEQRIEEMIPNSRVYAVPSNILIRKDGVSLEELQWIAELLKDEFGINPEDVII